jgi:hypothetical protein
MLSDRDRLIERHRPLCRYNGSGGKRWKRQNPGNGRGANRSRSENGCIVQCARKLYAYARDNKLDFESISEWRDIPADNRPGINDDDDKVGRCVLYARQSA